MARLQELGNLPRFFPSQIGAKPHVMGDGLPLCIAETLRRPDVVTAGTILGPELRPGLFRNDGRGLRVTDVGSLIILAAAGECDESGGDHENRESLCRHIDFLCPVTGRCRTVRRTRSDPVPPSCHPLRKQLSARQKG